MNVKKRFTKWGLQFLSCVDSQTGSKFCHVQFKDIKRRLSMKYSFGEDLGPPLNPVRLITEEIFIAAPPSGRPGSRPAQSVQIMSISMGADSEQRHPIRSSTARPLSRSARRGRVGVGWGGQTLFWLTVYDQRITLGAVVHLIPHLLLSILKVYYLECRSWS